MKRRKSRDVRMKSELVKVTGQWKEGLLVSAMW